MRMARKEKTSLSGWWYFTHHEESITKHHDQPKNLSNSIRIFHHHKRIHGFITTYSLLINAFIQSLPFPSSTTASGRINLQPTYFQSDVNSIIWKIIWWKVQYVKFYYNIIIFLRYSDHHNTNYSFIYESNHIITF